MAKFTLHWGRRAVGHLCANDDCIVRTKHPSGVCAYHRGEL